VRAIPLLTLLLDPKDCRTFFRNKLPSLIPGILTQSFSGSAATTAFVPSIVSSIYFPSSRLNSWLIYGRFLFKASLYLKRNVSLSTTTRLADKVSLSDSFFWKTSRSRFAESVREDVVINSKQTS